MKKILITSSGPGEGKTTISANLAAIIAQGGKRCPVDRWGHETSTHAHPVWARDRTGLRRLISGEYNRPFRDAAGRWRGWSICYNERQPASQSDRVARLCKDGPDLA